MDCIKIDTIKPARGVDFDCGETSNETRKKMIVPRFTIDMSECMYCNLCVYPCPEECIYMVGGPNEPKHDIDYEYSKYVKHDLVFEFSNVTDQQIIDIGAQSYLDERNSKINKIEDFYKENNIENLDIFYDTDVSLAKKFLLRGVPTTLIIGKEGGEVARIVGSIDFQDENFKTWLKTFD